MKHLIVTFFVLTSFVFAQSQKLTGTVVSDYDGLPLHLANVIVENSSNGITTDQNGEFVLTVNSIENQFVIISYVGFKKLRLNASELANNNFNSFYLEKVILSSQTILVESAIGKDGIKTNSFSNITKKDIEESHSVQKVPEYLSQTPSVTYYTDNGSSVGPTYLSIRGFGQRRISVSYNGIPQNDPEDHNSYWHNIANLVPNTELIQVQRGSGAGIIGYPSIGGSINLITSPFSDRKKFNFDVSLGSYNLRKYSASFASGLIDNKYSVYTNVSQTLSSGYRENSWVDLKSYYISAVRYDKNLSTQINLYGGPVNDGLVYTGLPKFAIEDKKLRRENYSGWGATDTEYTWKTRRRPEEVEQFSQPHFELLNEYKLSDKIKVNSALFLVLGNGYFDFDGSWADTNYLRLTAANGFAGAENPKNTLIRAMVENTQWGWIPRISFDHKNGKLVAGVQYRNHRSIHWASVAYGENLPANLTKNYRYNYYEGNNDIINAFVNETYSINEKLTLLGELQLAYHKYRIENEKHVDNSFTIDDMFLNPKFGINYKLNKNINTYFSFARVKREPRLKNYYDAGESSGGAKPQFELNTDGSYNFDKPLVQPETMTDFELGATFRNESLSFSANGYYMLFDDEIVKTGELDKFGAPKTTNMEKTIHSGIEVYGAVKFLNHFELSFNTTYSRNIISKENLTKEVSLKDNKIAGFPDLIANGTLKFRYRDFYFHAQGRYVGEYFSDNYDDKLTELNKVHDLTSYNDNKVEAYFVANLFASYRLKLNPALNHVKVFVQVNNLFDKLYAAHATGKEFFPAADKNLVAGIQVGL